MMVASSADGGQQAAVTKKAFIDEFNLDSGSVKRRAPGFRASLGDYLLLDVGFEPGSAWHAVLRYNVPLDWCHSFDPSLPISGANAPVAQGGLVVGLLDNAMSTALRVASSGRFQTTLSLNGTQSHPSPAAPPTRTQSHSGSTQSPRKPTNVLAS
jgi:hypothetical protein